MSEQGEQITPTLTPAESLVQDFINFKQRKTLWTREDVGDEKKHQEQSVELHALARGLLSKYGKPEDENSSTIISNFEINLNRLKGIPLSETPPVSMTVNHEEVQLILSDNNQAHGPDDEQGIALAISFKKDGYDNEETLLTFSEQNRETKNWTGNRIAPEQMTGAKDILSYMEKTLEKEKVAV
jgi:hypothetical protein